MHQASGAVKYAGSSQSSGWHEQVSEEDLLDIGDANDRVWSLNEETEKALTILAAVHEKYEEARSLM